jgi:hypothetical protein
MSTDTSNRSNRYRGRNRDDGFGAIALDADVREIAGRGDREIKVEADRERIERRRAR